MKPLKPPKTFDEQFQLLSTKQMSCWEKQSVISFLQRNNYYRFSGYTCIFRKQGGAELNGVDFDNVKRIYEFDADLRIVLFKYIQLIEIACRTAVAYYFTTHFNDAGVHYQKTYFINEKHYYGFLEEHYKYIRNNAKMPFVKKHINEYTDINNAEKINGTQYPRYRMPLWVAVELMPFGMLSKFYSNIENLTVKNDIAISLNTDTNRLKNWLHVLSTLRNKCAHHDRLYQIEIEPNVKLSKKAYLTLFNGEKGNLLFRAVLVMSKMLTKDERTSFVTDLDNLFKQYQRIEISDIGFPKNWKTIIDTYYTMKS